jgi:hypothetical protein
MVADAKSGVDKSDRAERATFGLQLPDSAAADGRGRCGWPLRVGGLRPARTRVRTQPLLLGTPQGVGVLRPVADRTSDVVPIAVHHAAARDVPVRVELRAQLRRRTHTELPKRLRDGLRKRTVPRAAPNDATTDNATADDDAATDGSTAAATKAGAIQFGSADGAAGKRGRSGRDAAARRSRCYSQPDVAKPRDADAADCESWHPGVSVRGTGSEVVAACSYHTSGHGGANIGNAEVTLGERGA